MRMVVDVFTYNGYLYGYSSSRGGTILVLADSRVRADTACVHYYVGDRVLGPEPLQLMREYQHSRAYAEIEAVGWYFIGSCEIESPVPLEPLVGTDLEGDTMFERSWRPRTGPDRLQYPVQEDLHTNTIQGSGSTAPGDAGLPGCVHIEDGAGARRWVTESGCTGWACGDLVHVSGALVWVAQPPGYVPPTHPADEFLHAARESGHVCAHPWVQTGSTAEHYRLWYAPDGTAPAGSWYHPRWDDNAFALILLDGRPGGS